MKSLFNIKRRVAKKKKKNFFYLVLILDSIDARNINHNIDHIAAKLIGRRIERTRICRDVDFGTDINHKRLLHVAWIDHAVQEILQHSLLRIQLLNDFGERLKDAVVVDWGLKVRGNHTNKEEQNQYHEEINVNSFQFWIRKFLHRLLMYLSIHIELVFITADINNEVLPALRNIP
jgi:hypothetical protein